ncbi:MAG: Gfo/Idh/MocA family protein [bacterium]
MPTIRIAVIGLSGCAAVHLQAVEWLQERGEAKLSAVVALPSERERYPGLVEVLGMQKVVLFDSIQAFLQTAENAGDILTVPIGIHQHVPVSIAALQAGFHVYCEKPVAATIQEVDQLIRVQRETSRKILIGFQHIYSRSVQRLKERICDGRLGPVKSIALLHGWPRSQSYYTRNDWAGRLRLEKTWVLDSPANNAMAHYLFNMLYLASSKPDEAASPSRVQAELYRANRIESADLIQVKFVTEAEVHGHAVLTHCTKNEIGPAMKVVCENGHADWQTDEGVTRVQYKDGTNERFDNPDHPNWRFDAFRDLISAVYHDSQPLCTPEFARAHTLLIDALHESCPGIVTIPEEFIEEEIDWQDHPPDTQALFRRVKNLDEDMRIALEEDLFLSELDLPWAKAVKSELFETAGYNFFPQARIESITQNS